MPHSDNRSGPACLRLQLWQLIPRRGSEGSCMPQGIVLLPSCCSHRAAPLSSAVRLFVLLGQQQGIVLLPCHKPSGSSQASLLKRLFSLFSSASCPSALLKRFPWRCQQQQRERNCSMWSSCARAAARKGETDNWHLAM